MITKKFLALFLCALSLCVASAQAMIYSRENITIVTVRTQAEKPDASKEEKKEEIKTEKEEEAPPAPVVLRHQISAEIFPMSSTQFDWFFNRAALPEGKGILVVLDNRDELALGWSNSSTAYDVLFIQGSGKIQAIVPELVLAELTESLEITGRIKAVLYLKSGEAARLDILPGDKIEHALFTPAPKILQ